MSSVFDTTLIRHMWLDLMTYDEDAAVRYVPVLGHEGQVGFRCEWLDAGRVTYLYLNPSAGGSGGDHHPNIFIYEGDSFLPWEDPPVCYIDLEVPT